ncbi:DUF535 domain-containing protein [Pectobacterium zantedeschiae]|uniref:DUF535 domain-containing protein n=2 Tax=Pectobacterium zantedeschiae TaxID=2034769 RepID=A0A9X8P434_9GAMM|nr:DUF535 domain-containing protein [Pectobacterium zantedeschiae]RYC40812.1 DUF535 domain-containing protein [Pectobacterium zantedeschiae]
MSRYDFVILIMVTFMHITSTQSFGSTQTQFRTAFSLLLALATGKHKPDRSWESVRWRIKYSARVMLHPLLTMKWLGFIVNYPVQDIFQRNGNQLYSKLQRPYLMASLPTHQTCSALMDHYRFIQSQPLHRQRLLYSQNEGGNVLASFQGKSGENYTLRLMTNDQMCKEGELSLQFESSEHVLAQMTFSILRIEGEMSLFVGGIQGPDAQTAHHVIQGATRDCHSLFPKRILLEGLLNLARSLNLAHVIAVSNETHIYKHWRYRSRKRHVFLADYNAFLFAHGGQQLPDGNIALPLSIPRKSEQEIPSRKRSEYRRRYALFDEVACQINGVLAGSLPLSINLFSRT